MVACLLFYKDSDHVLSQARLKGHLKIDDSTVREVQRQRASFVTAKRKLRQMGVSYSMVFPAKLHIVHAEGTTFLLHPKKWIEEQGLRDRRDEGWSQPEKDSTRSPGKGGNPSASQHWRNLDETGRVWLWQ